MRRPTSYLVFSRAALASAALLIPLGAPSPAAAQHPGPRGDAAPLGDSYRYEFRVSGGHDGSLGTATVLGDRVRIDPDDDRSDDWLLYDGRAGTIAAIHPRDRTYSMTDADRFANIVGVAMRAVGTVVTIRLRDVDISTRRLGPGEAIDGHPTVRYRLEQSYIASIGIFGGSEDMHMHVVTDYWVPTDVQIARNPMLELITTAQNALALRDQDFVEQTDEARRGLFTGTPLRTVVTSVERKGDEGDDVKSMTVELSNLRPTPPQPALLTIPNGYERRSDWSFESGRSR